MNETILVTYASKYGATREIAEKVAEVLNQAGLHTEMKSAAEVQNVSSYRAVILGSAIYVGSWPKEASAFLQANTLSLAERPTWLFASGPTGEGDPLQLVEGKDLPASLKPVVERIQPRGIVIFGGHIDPDKVNFIEKMAIKNLVKKPFGDFRDWQAIEAWAHSIVTDLKVSFTKQ